MRVLACLFVVAGCGDNQDMCTPPPGELPPQGLYNNPELLPLPETCIEGGLRDLPGRWFIVDPTQYFRYEYPRYEGDCTTGFRRKFAADDDHDLTDDGFTYHQWSDGTRYFARTEYRFDETVYVRAYAVCMVSPDELSAVYVAHDTDRDDRISYAKGSRFAPMDEPLASGLTLVGELGVNLTGGRIDALNLVIDGSYAYIAALSGFEIIDISNPALPRAVGHFDGSFNDIKVVNNGTSVVAFLSPRDSTDLTSVVDATVPTAPVFLRFLDEYSHSIFVDGTSLYLATYNESVPRYDVSSPLTPLRTGMAIVPGEVSGVHDLFVAGTRMFANNTTQGLVVFDVTPDLATSTQLGRDTKGYSHASWTGTAGGRPIILHGDEGMTRSTDGGAHLRVLDGDPASATFMQLLGKYQTRPEVGIHNFELHGDRAYIAYYQDGVRIVDLSNPAQPREVAHYNTWVEDTAFGSAFEGALGIRLVNGLIYVADDLRGLMIFSEQ